MATISPGGAYIGAPSQFLGKKLKPFSLTPTISSSQPTVKLGSGCRAQWIDAVHNLFVGVGVGLPCTVMECGDMIYRSTLPKSNGLTITAPGVTLALTVLSYLWATPGVAPGFFDMFVLAFVERLFRPTFRKDDFVLGKKLGEGSFGVVYKVSLSKKRGSEEGEYVLKKATEYGAVEIWMNERVRRACGNSCADFVYGFLEKSSKKGPEYWLLWKYEGESTLASLLQSKDFPYNVETIILGKVQDLPRGLERENIIIQTIMRQLLFALDGLHSTGIVHRDVKPQNIIFSEGSRSFKIIDLGAAADLRVGINYIPKEFLLDPRYAAPEQYIMSTQTPSAPSAPVAAALSPVLWQMNLPDRFDIYSIGLIFLQMIVSVIWLCQLLLEMRSSTVHPILASQLVPRRVNRRCFRFLGVLGTMLVGVLVCRGCSGIHLPGLLLVLLFGLFLVFSSLPRLSEQKPAFPSLRSDSSLIQFNRQLKRCDYDLTAWRKLVEPRAGPDLRKGFELLDLDGRIGWELLTSMVRYKARQRISAKAALAHPYFDRQGLLALSVMQNLRMQYFRATQQDYSEAANWVIQLMAKSGTEKDGGFTETQLQELREKEPRKKASAQRNALASALRLQRKLVKTVTETMDEITEGRKTVWWNRWIPREE